MEERHEGRSYDLWTRANIGEVLAGVVSPLTWSIFEPDINRMFRESLRAGGFRKVEGVRFATRHRGRVFFNVGAMYHFLIELQGLPSEPLFATLGGPDGSHGLPLTDRPMRLRKMIRYLPAIFRAGLQMRGIPARYERLLPQMEALAVELRQIDSQSLSDRELANRLRLLQQQIGPFLEILQECNNAAFNRFGSVRWLAQAWLRDSTLANDLVVGLAMTKTAEASAELYRIAIAAAADPTTREVVERAEPHKLLDALAAEPAAAATLAALRGFLDQYGHRCADELDMMTPRWVEEPAPILGIFRSYVIRPPHESPREVMERQRRTREEAYERARRALRRGVERLLPLRWLQFRSMIREAQRFVPLRENPKFHLLRIFLENRRLGLEMARRLVGRGVLERADDVFFLTYDELDRLYEMAYGESAPADAFEAPTPALEALVHELRAAVTARRAQHAEWLGEEPPDVLDSTGRPFAMAIEEAPAGRELVGIGASTGRITATARVIVAPEQGGEMREGDVLVAPFTDPGWTPLFPLASAVVTDIGGLLSHGAIVAREYGVPAVVNTRFATQRIRTGDVITVDGSEGVVYLDGPS